MGGQKKGKIKNYSDLRARRGRPVFGNHVDCSMTNVARTRLNHSR